jgi:3-deoxy-D-manno-octulosonate 8-phosphate phosphatase (KDO 8-P phosphatase)
MKNHKPNFKKIKLFLTDVDGCLTNGIVYVGKNQEFLAFDIQDGIGHRLAHYAGLTVGWLSGRHSEATAERGKKLRVSPLYLGVLNKLEKAQAYCQSAGISLSQVAYLGDDLIDLPLFEKVGWAVAVANARPEVKKAAHYVTKASGGAGAFREAVEKLIQAQGLWKKTVQKFHQMNRAPAGTFRLD